MQYLFYIIFRQVYMPIRICNNSIHSKLLDTISLNRDGISYKVSIIYYYEKTEKKDF